MIDTDKNYVQPTGRNMKQKLKELVDQSQSGDILVFHFSGHGARPAARAAPQQALALLTGDQQRCIHECRPAVWGRLD